MTNSQTGKIKWASKDEAEVKFFIDNPDYNGNPLGYEYDSLEELIKSDDIE